MSAPRPADAPTNPFTGLSREEAVEKARQLIGEFTRFTAVHAQADKEGMHALTEDGQQRLLDYVDELGELLREAGLPSSLVFQAMRRR